MLFMIVDTFLLMYTFKEIMPTLFKEIKEIIKKIKLEKL